MPPRSILTDLGTAGQVAKRMEMSGVAGVDTRPVMEEIAVDMFRIEKAVFSSQGRRGGGSWRRLKPDTIRKKGTTTILRTLGANPTYSPEEDTLYRSLTEPGSRFQVLRIGERSITFGTNRPFAAVHQRGQPSVGVPARPFLRFTPRDATRWEGFILNHILKMFGLPTNRVP